MKNINKYIAVFSDSAFSGVGIIEIIDGIDQKVKNEYYTPNGVSKKTCKVYSTTSNRSYFIRNKKRYYLDEFLKVN